MNVTSNQNRASSGLPSRAISLKFASGAYLLEGRFGTEPVLEFSGVGGLNAMKSFEGGFAVFVEGLGDREGCTLRPRLSVSQTSTWFGRYRLTSRIATGGMAEVYLGRMLLPDGRFGPAMAVKRLLPHLIADPAIVRMFLNEADITRQIQHPNVVRILDLGQVHSEPFIAMELLEGHSFAEVRQAAAQGGMRVPLGITLRVLTEACRGLDAAHRAVDTKGRELQIVHRDFTPDNIHVGVNGDGRREGHGMSRQSGEATAQRHAAQAQEKGLAQDHAKDVGF